MDDPECDPRRLRNTFEQFDLVNRTVSGWERVFVRYLAPRLTPGSTVLDIGCGGGDVARRLVRWGRRRGTPLRVTAIDPDPRALAFARTRPAAGVEYLELDAAALFEAGRRFDFVISNHVLHHLTAAELPGFLQLSSKLTRRLTLHNDLRRHGAAWLLFSLARPFFRDSFIVEDGLSSIRRAFTPDELRGLLPPGWRVDTLAPFRNLVLKET